MRIKYKVWSLVTIIISTIVCADIYFGYTGIESSIHSELKRDAEDIRSLIMAIRRVYQKQFIESGLPVTEATVGFLPAHALAKISVEFPHWSSTGIKFNNVTDRPRNPANKANSFEQEALAWFKANPQEKSRLVEISRDGSSFYHYTSPIRIEEYCLTCHGSRADAPPSIAATYADAYDYKIGDMRGILSIYLPTGQLRYNAYAAWGYQLALRLVGYVALLFALGCLLNKYVINRLARLEQNTRKLAAGDYSARVKRIGRDEIGYLATAINAMSREVQNRDTNLRESEECFRLTANSIKDALILLSGDGKIIFWNRAAEQIFGYTAEEAMGRVLHDLLVPDRHRASVAKGLNDFVRSGQGIFCGTGIEINATRKNGQEFAIELSLSSMDTQGKWIGVGLIRNISERKQVEAELQAHRERLEALVETRTQDLIIAKNAAEAGSVAKSAFLANMSHEIRTPLNAITGMIHILRKSGLTTNQVEKLTKIEIASSHLLEIINNVLELSKIEAGKFVLQHVPVHIPTLLENITSILGQKAQEKGIELITEVDPDICTVYGDDSRLQQALLNLTTNALKFTDAGRVTVRVRAESQTNSTVTYRFEVEDTGIGISAEQQPRLFSAFEQADNSMNRKYGGTGLGLAITKKIAELMGGKAGMVSAEGKGSTFWFTAVLRKDAPQLGVTERINAEEAERTIKQKLGGKRILLVEDEPINREIAQALLEDVGFIVDLAEDGGKAIERVQAATYDLILMDMQMPHINGLEATRQIRLLPEGATIPIIAMTANAFAEDRELCIEAGMNDFIAKPVSVSLLYQKLCAWLQKRK